MAAAFLAASERLVFVADGSFGSLGFFGAGVMVWSPDLIDAIPFRPGWTAAYLPSAVLTIATSPDLISTVPLTSSPFGSVSVTSEPCWSWPMAPFRSAVVMVGVAGLRAGAFGSFGYQVDDSTQKLLDQAVAAGQVGEKHRSVQEQTLDVMKHLDAVLSGIGQKFGVDIPNDIDKTAAAFDNAGDHAQTFLNGLPDSINIPATVTYETNGQLPGEEDRRRGPEDQHDTSRPYARGGPVYAARGFWVPRGSDTVPAMLTPGEFVISRPAVNRIGASVLNGLNRGSVSSAAAAAGGAVVILQVDGRELARAVATPLPNQVRRLGVRVRT